MQGSVTHTRDWSLLGLADRVERDGTGIAAVLRESRLDFWSEPDRGHEEMLGMIMEPHEAEFYAGTRLFARVTIPCEPGAWETIVEDDGLTWSALKAMWPELDDWDLVEAEPGELAAQSPSAAVRCRQWQELWFRSQAEVCIAEALDRANVLFTPNASIRLGVSPDHRDNVEVDFLVIAGRKVGVLEVDGAPWHPPARADEHHERDRRVKEHGVAVVERYASDACTAMPDDVVASFLRLLKLIG